jgi:hypothetical protein
MAKKKGNVRPEARRLHRGRRVYLLGAGVSAACGIPVAKDILSHSVAALGREDKATQERIHELLRYLYPTFDEGIGNYPNIDDFLNLIEMAETFNTEEFISSSRWSPADLTTVKGATLKAVTDYIWSRMGSENEMSSVRDFVHTCVRAGDTIITFNWDLTIEHALESRTDFSFWYGPRGDADVLLLKPHGSVDWFPRSRLPRKDSKHRVSKLDDDLCVYPKFDFATYRELRTTEPVIVPPILVKRFNWDFLRQVWKRVYIEISRAARLYILGYSLPREDQFARLVIGRALLNNRLNAEGAGRQPARVTLVNPDEAVQPTFIRLLGRQTRILFVQTTFEKLIHAVKEGDTTLQ